MKPIASEELSAYLDGELAPQRMQQVERALASDTVLQQEFVTLDRLDASLRDVALKAQFVPAVNMPSGGVSPRRTLVGLAAIVASLAAIRLIPKILALPVSDWLIVNAVVIALLLAATTWLIRREAQALERVGMSR